MIQDISLLEQSVELLLPAAYRLLRRLGITENYKGFRYAAYAAAIAAMEPNRLFRLTKLLYPDVAKHFGSTWTAVERDLRTVIGIAWQRNPLLLTSLADVPLPLEPSCSLFLAILSRHLPPSSASCTSP